MTDAEDFIRSNLPAGPAPDVPGVLLHMAGSASRLGSLVSQSSAPPYWAYPWAGGMALALHIQVRPEMVRDRAVVDIGAGSGLVAIAAMKAGAAGAVACDADAVAQVAIRLNARLNGVHIDVAEEAEHSLSGADLLLAGDVFYDERVAATMSALFEKVAGKTPILIGDPFRRALPCDSLDLIAEYEVSDFASGKEKVRAGVFRWRQDR